MRNLEAFTDVITPQGMEAIVELVNRIHPLLNDYSLGEVALAFGVILCSFGKEKRED